MVETVPTAGVDTTVVQGHFLTRAEAAHLSGVPTADLQSRAGFVRIPGPYAECEEAYPAFQFRSGGGLVPGLAEVVRELEGSLDCLSLAAYLTAVRPDLGGSSIVDCLGAGASSGSVIAVLEAA